MLEFRCQSITVCHAAILHQVRLQLYTLIIDSALQNEKLPGPNERSGAGCDCKSNGGHMKRVIAGLCVVFLLIVLVPASAQKQNPLIGTWENFSYTEDGKDARTSEGAPAGTKRGLGHTIFTADGHFMLMRFSTGRPPGKVPEQRTKEDFLIQFWGSAAQYGTYTLKGNNLTRKVLVAANPNGEAVETKYTFRIEGSDLVITTVSDSPKIVQRFRRLKDQEP
jgi:hypothetical protein